MPLNTSHPTIVHGDYLLDPSIMDNLPTDDARGCSLNHKRNVVFYDYSEKSNYYCNFVRDITSGFLEMNGFEHNKNKWYMDIIRYRLDNDTKRVSSGLAWHCENDNYPNVISVLLYLNIDEGIKEGNLRYKDKHNNKIVLKIKSGTTVIMDGNVPHKPQDPYGSGKRDLIIMSFEK
tara:strand:- start:182 stop:709 length:528 start_codon:yes stop_codon:yes gene_type:complete